MKVFLDMDGVLADFEGRLRKVYPNLPSDLFSIPDEQFWPLVKAIPDFWENLPLMKGARKLVDYAKRRFKVVAILSAPSRHDQRSLTGKKAWLDRNFPEIKERHFVRAEEKQKYSGYGCILIDDQAKNCQQWENSGGVAILHKTAEDSIKRLQVLAKHPKILVPVKKRRSDNRLVTYWVNLNKT